jgi:PAS domain S-box-containing protein
MRMPAAPLPANEESRLRALYAYGILDTGPEAAFDDIAQIAAAICDTPIALITFVDRERQWLKARVGIEIAETRREDAFCAWAIHETGVTIVPDAPADRRFADNPFVTGEPHIRFYAGAPIAAPSGANLGTVCVLDTKPGRLTNRQREALEALARQVTVRLEERQRAAVSVAFLENSSSIIYVKNDQLQFQLANAALRQLLPPGAELLGRTSAEVFGRDTGRALDDADRAALENESETAVSTTDDYGSVKCLTARFRVPSLQGPDGVGAIGIDVTELRAAERRAHAADLHLRDLVQNIPAVIWERRYDASGNVVSSFVSPYIRQLFGYTEEEWLSAPDFWARAFEPHDRAELESKLLEGGLPTSHLYRVTVADGRRCWVEMTITGFVAGDGFASGTRAVMLDATEGVEARLKREIDERIYTEFSALNNELATAQRSLLQQRNELRFLNQEKNRFIGMTAHDLRNPLGAILLFVDVLLRKALLSDDQRAPVLRIRDIAQKMRGIIDGFLNVASIEAGELTLRRSVADVNDVVAGVVELQRPLAEQKNIRLDFVGSDAVPLALDVWKIEQVITNLITNAIKFSPAGAVVTAAVKQRDDVVEISVRDTGPGIHPDVASRLFEPFTRGDTAPTAGEPSVGLGLAICRKIIEAHGGRITIESTPGEGATFYVVLPASSSSRRAASIDSAASAALPSAPTSRQSSD